MHGHFKNITVLKYSQNMVENPEFEEMEADSPNLLLSGSNDFSVRLWHTGLKTFESTI